MEIKQLEIAKTIPFADTNRNLKRFIVPDENRGNGSLWQLLMGGSGVGEYFRISDLRRLPGER